MSPSCINGDLKTMGTYHIKSDRGFHVNQVHGARKGDLETSAHNTIKSDKAFYDQVTVPGKECK